MSTELHLKLLSHLKTTTGNPVFDVILDSRNPEVVGNAYHVRAFLKSLSQPSLSFVFYQAKECRRNGDFNKAMLKVSELVRDHVTALRNIQLIFDRISGEEPRNVVLKQFGQVEPLEVHLKNAPHVLRIVEEVVAPWRDRHSPELSEYLTGEKQADLEQEKYKLLERLSPAQVSSDEFAEQEERYKGVIDRQEELRYQMATKIVDLAQHVINDMAGELIEPDRAKHLEALLSPLTTIALSDVITKHADNLEGIGR
jgi:hypothetical protein